LLDYNYSCTTLKPIYYFLEYNLERKSSLENCSFLGPPGKKKYKNNNNSIIINQHNLKTPLINQHNN